jgi:hypothetical protein
MSAISLRVRLMSGILGCGSVRKAVSAFEDFFLCAIAAKLGASELARV